MKRRTAEQWVFKNYCETMFMKRLRDTFPDMEFSLNDSVETGWFLLYSVKWIDGNQYEKVDDLWEVFHFKPGPETAHDAMTHIVGRIKVAFDKAEARHYAATGWELGEEP